ncbi:hypothetical protein [Lysobacter antibioticus]|uniref:Haem-binding uptake Tiki superfamily ChaN domain-containing protein n=1 Tax=Lysobacter antibioticus TaxID=84531 RepID=A0A0S2FF58_LYSAN|nr:hypothetical protein [Lysobacter antibioticus]ALN82169.1 hypothetical protein LA76x_4053 [Lysobacter antibioticus]
MSKWWLAVLLLLPSQAFAAQTAQAGATPATVIVLGVDHAAQLVSERDQPALLDAFLARAKPDAICIERAPEAFARGDFYEFTYEAQDVAVPFARRHGIELCPIDWEPPAEDQRLGFGISLDAPPELRPVKGFMGFLAFGQEASTRDFFHADDPAKLHKVANWATTPAARAKNDLPRRLYLYRTYLQAQRIAAAARAHPGGTVVVVVGEFHKHDIEAILKDDPGVRLVQPSSLGRPDAKDIAAHDRSEYRTAIASFNLLGLQSQTGPVDYGYVGRAVAALEADGATPQARLFRVRLDLLQGRIERGDAIARYRAIAADAGDARFAWTGVKDTARVDSWFDPFGNLDVRRRALLEAARESWAAGDAAVANELLEACTEGLSPRQREQLRGYWQRDVAVANSPR